MEKLNDNSSNENLNERSASNSMIYKRDIDFYNFMLLCLEGSVIFL